MVKWVRQDQSTTQLHPHFFPGPNPSRLASVQRTANICLLPRCRLRVFVCSQAPVFRRSSLWFEPRTSRQLCYHWTAGVCRQPPGTQTFETRRKKSESVSHSRCQGHKFKRDREGDRGSSCRDLLLHLASYPTNDTSPFLIYLYGRCLGPRKIEDRTKKSHDERKSVKASTTATAASPSQTFFIGKDGQ